MAWTVDDIYRFVKQITKKNIAGGISPENLFYIWNSEQRAFHSDLLGRFQPGANNKSGANTGLIQNKTILTKLLPFTKNVIGLTVTSGSAAKPSDFVLTLVIRTNGYDVKPINSDQKSSVINSIIDPPVVADNKYYYWENLNSYVILPSSVATIDLDYICDVTDIVWGFTTDGSGRPIYSSGASTQPKWGNAEIVEITKRALKSLGVAWHDQDFERFGQSVIKEGN